MNVRSSPGPVSRPSAIPDDRRSDAPASVILVREWEQQMSSSGCCGRLEGDFLTRGSGGPPVFEDRRRQMECAGTLYRELRARHGNAVDVQIVDPRNLVTLVPLLVREGRRNGVRWREIFASVLGVSVNMVVVNGRVVSRNRWPSVEEVEDYL